MPHGAFDLRARFTCICSPAKETGAEYLSLKLDDPSFTAPVYASLVQGESSSISGAVIAESARLSGKVNGSITARELVILKSAQIEGDVHYDALTIEQGAQVDGRFAPNARPAVKAVPSASVEAAE